MLSGFLITRLIAEELRTGEFSLFKFYERTNPQNRARFFVVCASCMVVAVIVPAATGIEALLLKPDRRGLLSQQRLVLCSFRVTSLLLAKSGRFCTRGVWGSRNSSTFYFRSCLQPLSNTPQPDRRAGLVRICRIADLERHLDRRAPEEFIFSDPHPSLGTVGRQRHRSRTGSSGDVPVAARTRRYRRSDWDRGSDRRFQFAHTVSRLRRVASLFRCRAHHMGR